MGQHCDMQQANIYTVMSMACFTIMKLTVQLLCNVDSWMPILSNIVFYSF